MISISITNEEFAFCEALAKIRTGLQKDGDPSIGYTTYADRRAQNNLMGQVSEFAVLKYLHDNKISFSGPCFAITYLVSGDGVLPPLADYILFNGQTIDIKSDRYPLDKYPPIIPTEKLNDLHVADYTFWLEYNETNDNRNVIIFGWNDKQEILGLLNAPDAVRPNGDPMPKPCKRVDPNSIRDISQFPKYASGLISSGRYQLAAEKIEHFWSQGDDLEFPNDNEWGKSVINQLLDHFTGIRLSIYPFNNGGKRIISVACESINGSGNSSMINFYPDDSQNPTRKFYLTLTAVIERWLSLNY